MSLLNEGAAMQHWDQILLRLAKKINELVIRPDFSKMKEDGRLLKKERRRPFYFLYYFSCKISIYK